ncbi:MAG TPA: sugar phosphate nucleotidyltransferase, partial [Actinomycetota bacterium]|nr:sugar phosphate nucleotidyltransferase [Actinomycetota bacterium]
SSPERAEACDILPPNRVPGGIPISDPKKPVAVVMAGGRGQRLRPLTDKVPKPLLRVGASSIIERIIASLASADVEDCYLAVNYKAEAFEERLGDGSGLGVRIHYLREKEPLGTAGPLSLLPDGVGTTLVTNADILTRLDFRDLLEDHARHDAPVTVAATEYRARIPYAVLRTEGDRLLSIEEKPEQPVLCNAGIYVIDEQVRALVPSERMLDMPDLLEKAIADGYRVRVFPIGAKWFDIGSPEDFERVLLEFATGEEE